MKLILSFFNEPAFIAGMMALIGLIALKKPISKIVNGTLKTIIGFVIFSSGATVICNALNVIGPAFQDAFHMQGVVPTNEAFIGIIQKNFGTEMALIMAFGFLVNLLIARLTSLKYVFLTGHHILFMSGLIAAVLSVAGFKGVELIIVGSLLQGATMVITPAVVQPYYRKVTGGDTVAMGHYNALTYVIAAEISKLTGDKSRSTEDVKVPESLSFFRDNVISTSIVMFIITLICMLAADSKTVAKLAGTENIFIFSVMTALTFSAGFVIVLQGVRMMLAEIVPAFKGIAEKIVPDAIPALDCPVIFPFAPNAVIIGFLASLAGALVTFAILPFTGLPIIIPGLIPAFFVGAAAGVLANAQGGLRGTIIGCFVNGLILNFLPALLLPLLGSLGFANTTFGDADFVFNGIVIGNLAKSFSKAGVYGLLVVILAIFVGVTVRAKGKAAAKQTKAV
ncbi:MAG: PTS ascorbate transporter subunit IIC [Bacillota bacterium]|nr:PTS ascorbate transporter subunit IIC [Bacillota bacterium]